MRTNRHNLATRGNSEPAYEMDQYSYEALQTDDSIRVLILEPSEIRSAPLRGSITQLRWLEEIEKLEGRQEYSAVSYTWGGDFTEQLIITGEIGVQETYMPITQDVRVMLEHFRKPHTQRHLWIDAICLNQSDAMEKAVQINLMGDIYAHAKKVYIWLGPEGEEGGEMAKVFSYFRLLQLLPERADAVRLFGDDDKCTSAIDRFFQRRWFFRRWTLQESYLARRAIVHLGHHSIPFSDLLSICRRLHAPEQNTNRYGIEMALTLSDVGGDLFVLLWKLHRSDCGEKIDRIRALLGLIPAESRLPPMPSNNYVDIYTAYASELVDTAHQHELFYHLSYFGSLAETGDKSMPSWVPAWYNERRTPTIECLIGTVPDSTEQRGEVQTPCTLQYLRREEDGFQEIKPFTSSYSPLSLAEWRSWRHWVFKCHEALTYHRLHQRFKMDSSHMVAPCTIFYTRKLAENVVALRTVFAQPWAGTHGRRVTTVIAQDSPFTNIETARDVFKPLNNNFDMAFPDRLFKFSGLVLRL